MKKTPLLLLIFITMLIAGSTLLPTGLESAAAQTGTNYTYLPVVVKRPSEWGAGLPIMLGTYVDGWLANQSDIDSRLHGLDNWADDVGGAHLSIAGTFIDIELDHPSYYATHVTEQLDMVWDNGYTPFVNLTTTQAAYKIARGGCGHCASPLGPGLRRLFTKWGKDRLHRAAAGNERFLGSLRA